MNLGSRVCIHQHLRQSALSVFHLLLGGRFLFFYMLNEPLLSDKITAVPIAGNSDFFIIILLLLLFFTLISLNLFSRRLSQGVVLWKNLNSLW